MAGISVSAAAGAGFELIGRKPLTVLLWGLLIFVAGVLPLVGIFALVAPTMIEVFRQAAMHPTAPPDPAEFASMAPLMVLNPLIQLVSILGRAVLCGAVFRAVLTPADSRFAYLRIGMKEIWLAVLYLAEIILAVMLFVAAAIPVAIVVSLAFVFLNHAVAALFTVVTVLAAFGLFVWVLLRFALAAPMTFEDGEFRLFESWALTRGHALQLLGMVLLLLLFIMLIEMVIMVLFGASMLAVVGTAHFQRAQIAPFLQQLSPNAISAAAGVFVAIGLVGSVVAAAFQAVVVAPFAAFYRMVRPAPDAPPPAVAPEPIISPDPTVSAPA